MSELRLFMNYENPGRAFITGASAGLGRSFANKLAEYGFDLVLLARRKDRLQAMADELTSRHSIECEIIQADLADLNVIIKVANQISQIKNLDVIVNCAGFATVGHFADVPIEKSMRMKNVHITATMQFTHAALQTMLKRNRGAIINVSSMGAFTLTPGNVVYDATKSFLNTFSENLWLEVEKTGIRIQALCPGFTRTEFHEVGDLVNFNRSSVPESLWMTSDEVVSESLRALEKNKELIFIPGWKNRLSKWLILHSGFVRKAMQKKVKDRDLK